MGWEKGVLQGSWGAVDFAVSLGGGAAVGAYHTQSDSDNGTLFLSVLEAGRPGSRLRQSWGLQGPLLGS